MKDFFREIGYWIEDRLKDLYNLFLTQYQNIEYGIAIMIIFLYQLSVQEIGSHISEEKQRSKK